MAQQVGGANFLFTQLMQTLDNYNSVGPPPVIRKGLTLKDEKFAKEHKEWELGEEGEDLFYKVDVRSTLESSEEMLDEENDGNELPPDNLTSTSIECSECGVNSTVLISHLEIEEESTQALKRLQSAQQEGLQIE